MTKYYQYFLDHHEETDADWMEGGIYYDPTDPTCIKLMKAQALEDLPEGLDLMEDSPSESPISFGDLLPIFSDICESFILAGGVI